MTQLSDDVCETHGDHAAELPSGASAGVSHTLTYESAAFFFFLVSARAARMRSS